MIEQIFNASKHTGEAYQKNGDTYAEGLRVIDILSTW